MPKWGRMTQISRPFVIAVAAVLLFAAVWFVALKPHTSSSTETTVSTPAPSPRPSGAAEEKANAAPSPIDHTSTPGLEGLTKDINRAHGAVAATQANGRRVEEKATQASGGGPASTTPGTSSAGQTATPRVPAPTSHATHRTATAPSTSKSSSTAASVRSAAAAAAARRAQAAQGKAASEAAKAAASAGKETTTRIPARQALVEVALKEQKIAVLLFFNPHSAEDQVVRLSVGLIAGVHELFESLQSNPRTSKQSGDSLGKIAVFEAEPSQVASFGSLTRTVQVLQTPTILIINPLGQVTSIPGYTETQAISQRIDESRKAFEAAPAKTAKHAAK